VGAQPLRLATGEKAESLFGLFEHVRADGAVPVHQSRVREASPSAEAARARIQGEMRMLRAIRHIVIRDMAERLA
jgi:hypothetical protein